MILLGLPVVLFPVLVALPRTSIAVRLLFDSLTKAPADGFLDDTEEIDGLNWVCSDW